MKATLLSVAVSFVLIASNMGCLKSDQSTLKDRFYLRHAGAEMPVHVYGNRSSNTFILTIHGAGSFGLAFRNGAFIDQLEERYAVVYWDQRGQGNSQGSYPATDDILGLMASDIGALVEVLKAKYGDDINLVLMGHSLGGLLGLESLLNQGLQDLSHIKGWISISGAHDFAQVRVARHALLLEVASAQITAGVSTDSWTAIRDQATQLDPTNDVTYDAILDLVVSANAQLEADGLVSAARPAGLTFTTLFQINPLTWFFSQLLNRPIDQAVTNDYSLTPQLANLSVPSLWLYGSYDFSVPPAIGQLAQAIEGSSMRTYTEFTSSAHWLFYSEPDRFADEVVGFVEGL